MDVHRVAIWFDVPLETGLQRNGGRGSLAFGDRQMPEDSCADWRMCSNRQVKTIR